MANPVPDRSGHPNRRLYGKTFGSTLGHTSAHEAATDFNKTWMAHDSNWEVQAWKSHPEGVPDTTKLWMGSYDRAVPHTKGGKSGVMLFRGSQGMFHPNESLSALEQRKKR